MKKKSNPKIKVNSGLYKINGKNYDRVTSVIGNTLANPNLVRWKVALGAKESTRIGMEAAAFGTEVHHSLETTLKGEKYIVPAKFKDKEKDILQCRSLGLHFLKSHRLSPVEMEQTIYSEKFRVAGTCDVICKNSLGQLAMVDWKTGNIYKTAHIQIATYRHLYNEMGKGLPVKLYIVRLGKGHQKEPYIEEADHTNFSHFVSLLKLFRGVIQA